MVIDTLIKEIASETPDPEKTLKNFRGLLHTSPEFLEENPQQIEKIAKLFSYSQFLADYSIKNPDRLSVALQNLSEPASKQLIISKASEKCESVVKATLQIRRQEAMRFLREMKKNHLLRITIRDTSGITSLNECMKELSVLSEAIIELALNISHIFLREKFGDLSDDTLSIIGLGKLGAEELN